MTAEIFQCKHKHMGAALLYLLRESDDPEAVLDGIKLLLVQLTGDDVLHYLPILTVNVPAH